MDETLRPGVLTNVCGIVKDFRAPMPTARTGELGHPPWTRAFYLAAR